MAKNPGTIVAIAKGARMAVDECQHQFENRRWNCPVEKNGHGGSIFGKILEKGKLQFSLFLINFVNRDVRKQLCGSNN